MQSIDINRGAVARQNDRQTQRQDGVEINVFKISSAEFFQFAGVSQHQLRQRRLLAARETRHIGVGRDIGRMLVIGAVRNRQADFVQLSGPAQQALIGFGSVGAQLRIEPQRQFRDPSRLLGIGAVALRELQGGDFAHVLRLLAPEQVVEHAQAQRGIRHFHRLYAQFLEDAEHDGQPAGRHRHAVGFEPLHAQLVEIARPHEGATQFAQPLQGDVARLVGRVEATAADHVGQGARRTAGTHRMVPAIALEVGGDNLNLLARRNLGRAHGGLVHLIARKEALAHRHAADVERLHHPWLIALADDELGRAPADIDHQAFALHHRDRMRRTDIDQPRLFPPGNDLDRKPQRRLRALQKLRRILGHAHRVGGHGPHPVRMKLAQALAEALQGLQRDLLRGFRQILFVIQPRCQTYRLAQGVDGIDLHPRRTVLRPSDKHAKTVRSKIDGGKVLIEQVGHKQQLNVGLMTGF